MINEKQLLLPIEGLDDFRSSAQQQEENTTHDNTVVDFCHYRNKKNTQDKLSGIKEYLDCFRIFKEG